eukprot:g6741.t1
MALLVENVMDAGGDVIDAGDAYGKLLNSLEQAHAGKECLFGRTLGRSVSDHTEMFGARPGVGGYKRARGGCHHLATTTHWWQGADARARATNTINQAFEENSRQQQAAVRGGVPMPTPEAPAAQLRPAGGDGNDGGPARGVAGSAEARYLCESTRAYARRYVEDTHGQLSARRRTVGRRNVSQQTVLEMQATDLEGTARALQGAPQFLYRTIAQRQPGKVGSAPLPPPPPAGSAARAERHNFAHSEITRYSEHLRRLPTFRGQSALPFYTTGYTTGCSKPLGANGLYGSSYGFMGLSPISGLSVTTFNGTHFNDTVKAFNNVICLPVYGEDAGGSANRASGDDSELHIVAQSTVMGTYSTPVGGQRAPSCRQQLTGRATSTILTIGSVNISNIAYNRAVQMLLDLWNEDCPCGASLRDQ